MGKAQPLQVVQGAVDAASSPSHSRHLQPLGPPRPIAHPSPSRCCRRHLLPISSVSPPTPRPSPSRCASFSNPSPSRCRRRCLLPATSAPPPTPQPLHRVGAASSPRFCSVLLSCLCFLSCSALSLSLSRLCSLFLSLLLSVTRVPAVPVGCLGGLGARWPVPSRLPPSA